MPIVNSGKCKLTCILFKIHHLIIEEGTPFSHMQLPQLPTEEEMLEEAAELYDCGDDTNACELAEYYGLTDIEIA